MTTLIIGGGAIGLSVAYHLSKRGMQEVTLLERNRLTSGTSWHAAGIVGPLRATPNMTRLASYALDLFPRLENEIGGSIGYRRTGGYWLARVPERMDELHRIADLGRSLGMSPRVITPGDVSLPQLSLDDHVGALHVPEDGNVNPVDLCMAYAKVAKVSEIVIKENAGVARLVANDGHIRGAELTDGTQFLADKVILCAGAWSRALAATVGVSLPLQAVEHMYVVTEPLPHLPNPFPVIRDLDTGIYIKGDAGKLVIGGFEPDAKCWNPNDVEGDRPFLELPEDWDQFAPFMEAALDLVPDLKSVGIQHFMNGPESFTSDTRPLVGQTPEIDGLFVAAGMNSVGVMSSAGIGRELADWVVDGEPSTDMWEVDVARADPLTAAPRHLELRMEEAVADLFALHWPFKQPNAGRGLRQSALHDRWSAQGAAFGLTGGWERGLWYAQSKEEQSLPYTIGRQYWEPIAARETANLAEGTCLLDLSPFTKLRIEGPLALAGLNHLSTAQLDVVLGRAVYTQMLNQKGGIELDVTVTRVDKDAFHLTSGAATRQRDLAWLRRNLPISVTISDETEDYVVIGVMGAGSRELLTTLAEEWVEKPFGHSKIVSLAGVKCRATRISFVGTLGWEIRTKNEDAGTLFDALIDRGAIAMGHYALEGCRIEKAFKHWGHDIGPTVTPLEAGLGFTIDWNKRFQGREALKKQRDQGLRQRLILFDVEGDRLLLHDEPIWSDGEVVGFTTSGARGPRTQRNLAFGLIETSPLETKSDISGRSFEIQIAGGVSRAVPVWKAPYDPCGTEMRS
ncbi:MAG: FAD-dependent oxidoreductase [Pseudomonadota bacterium]